MVKKPLSTLNSPSLRPPVISDEHGLMTVVLLLRQNTGQLVTRHHNDSAPQRLCLPLVAIRAPVVHAHDASLFPIRANGETRAARQVRLELAAHHLVDVVQEHALVASREYLKSAVAIGGDDEANEERLAQLQPVVEAQVVVVLEAAVREGDGGERRDRLPQRGHERPNRLRGQRQRRKERLLQRGRSQVGRCVQQRDGVGEVGEECPRRWEGAGGRGDERAQCQTSLLHEDVPRVGGRGGERALVLDVQIARLWRHGRRRGVLRTLSSVYGNVHGDHSTKRVQNTGWPRGEEAVCRLFKRPVAFAGRHVGVQNQQ